MANEHAAAATTTTTEGQKFPVKLYVYDLSNGLARSLSLQLTGRQFDAIYHTSIVVHGREYYFGQGIFVSDAPGRTHFGTPIEQIDMGETYVDQDTLQEIINDLRERYTAQSYHLLRFNCNTFSNELANIIVGQDIPQRITSLPQDFLSTPFGQMMGPQIDAMFRGAPSAAASQASASNGFAANPHLPASGMGILNNITRTAISNGHAASPSTVAVRHIESVAQLEELKRSASSLVVMFTSHTCPPCVQLHPVYASLAARYSDAKSIRHRPIAFAQAEQSQNTQQLFAQQSIAATPTFQFYEHGVKVSELKGASPSSLEDAIEDLLWRSHRPHPHSKLPIDPASCVPAQWIEYKTIPNLTFAEQKLNEITAKHKSKTFAEKADLQDCRAVLTKTLIPWIREGAKQRRMQDAEVIRWCKGARRCIDILQHSDIFPVVDLIRMALLSKDQRSTLAQSENANMLDDICAKAASAMEVRNKATLLTTYRLIGNMMACEDTGLSKRIAQNEQTTALLVFGILSEEESLRTAAINAAFNWSRWRAKDRSTFQRASADIVDDEVNVDAEVEVLCALLECIEKEQQSERLHRAAATLVVLLYCIDGWQATVQPLLEVVDAHAKLNAKKATLIKDTSEKAKEICTLLDMAMKLSRSSALGGRSIV